MYTVGAIYSGGRKGVFVHVYYGWYITSFFFTKICLEKRNSSIKIQFFCPKSRYHTNNYDFWHDNHFKINFFPYSKCIQGEGEGKKYNLCTCFMDGPLAPLRVWEGRWRGPGSNLRFLSFSDMF